jgi:NAD(P)H-flavin reductase
MTHVEPGGRAVTDALVPQPWRVLHRRQETADTVTLRLTPIAGGQDPPAAGQFNMLSAFGVGEIPISSSSDSSRGTLTHTIRAVGAVSSTLCSRYPGDMVGVRGPYGRGWDVSSAAGGDVIIVGGGIGLAPLRPVVEEVRRHRSRYGRVSVLVGARTPGSVLYARQLAGWAARSDLHVGVTVDRATAVWPGPVGVVTQLLAATRFNPAATTAFVCGPEVMMRFAARTLIDRGLPPGRIRVSLERNMPCGVGRCGHCQLGPLLICRDGPVAGWDVAAPLVAIPEL